MVVLDLFPAGILQFNSVVENGLWFARSNRFMESTAFQSLTWLRIVGGSIFVLGGVIPLTWFVIKNYKNLKSEKTGTDFKDQQVRTDKESNKQMHKPELAEF
jgi:nitric oxide reductase subunit B